jgi:hypothetical protein
MRFAGTREFQAHAIGSVTPGATALTRMPFFAYSSPGISWRRSIPPLVSEASTDGTLLFAWSTGWS